METSSRQFDSRLDSHQRSGGWRRDTKAVVISLRRSTTRAANVASIVETCPLGCEVWDATDGSALTPEYITSVYRPHLHRPFYPFSLKPGEIGCYLSHRSIWQKMVQLKTDRLLVLEDDITFLPNFSQTLQHAIEHAPDGSYVQFQVRDLKFPESAPDRSRQPWLIRPNLAPLRTSAQLVTLGAAQRLLEFSQGFDRPVDAAIQMTWQHAVDVLVAIPQSVIEVSASIGGSTIVAKKKRRPLLETICREWNRNRYRQSIAKYANKYVQHQPAVRSPTNQRIA